MTTTPATKKKRAPRAKAAPEPTPKPYHHGDLPQALLAAAEAVLVRDGLAGLGLRSIAREAGVSHTAPKHHFGDIAGLLSELAAAGYRRLRSTLLDTAEGVADPAERRNAVGRGYVRFACAHPALFGLMFRNELLDMKHPALAEATREAMKVMASVIGGGVPLPTPATPAALEAADAMRLTASWAYVHGLSVLLIDQRLRGIVKSAPDFATPEALVDAVLGHIRLRMEIAP